MYSLEGIEKIITNILLILMKNQNLMKCLKYDGIDALYQSDLTDNEIFTLFDQENIENTRIFFTPFNLNITDTTRSELRFYIAQFKPDNIHVASVKILFQVIVHNSIWRLDNGKQRPLVMIQEILKSLNDQDVGMVGQLYFDNTIELKYFNEHFSGYHLMPTTRSI